MSLLGLLSKKSLSGGGAGETGSKSLLSDNKDKRESGFTIVEVMIVLAIAGLVLAIVFIAVPALQRNSRNTQRRSDLANLRAQVDTWTGNNNGKLPNDNDDIASIIGSTGWGHYNGNLEEPGSSELLTATTANVNAAVANVSPAGKAAGDQDEVAEYVVVYAHDVDPAANIALPGRQEIHIWGEMACGADILHDGNDKDVEGDNPGTEDYDAADIVASNARALAYVYQIEGEDNARCEDNV